MDRILGSDASTDNPPELIDICVNLTHESFRRDEQALMERAWAAGVSTMICPGSSVDDSEQGLRYAERYPGRVYCGVGVHPHLAQNWNTDAEGRLRDMARHPGVRLYGECGLDYNRDLSPRPVQRSVLDMQLALACELKLPVLLHEREAYEDFRDMIKPYRDAMAGGVVHCFTGERKALFAYLDLDLHIGITGWICDERRGAHLKELVRQIPASRLLIETDAPYLLPRTIKPAPRERRNEPAFLTEVLAAIADSRQTDAVSLAADCTRNARALFNLERKTELPPRA